MTSANLLELFSVSSTVFFRNQVSISLIGAAAAKLKAFIHSQHADLSLVSVVMSEFGDATLPP